MKLIYGVYQPDGGAIAIKGIILVADALEEAIGLSHTIIVLKDAEMQKRFTGMPGAKPSLYDLVHHMIWGRRIYMECIKPHLPWLTLIFLVLVVGIANPAFFDPAGLIVLSADVVPLFVMALGMTFAIYIGGIDLSVQQMPNLVTVIATVYLVSLGIWVSVLCILVGALFGAVSGYVTTRLYVPSFVCTLALGFGALSGAKWLSGRRALHMDAERRGASFGWVFDRTFGLLNELIIAAVLLAICWFLQTRTTFGRSLKAVGAGELAASRRGSASTG